MMVVDPLLIARCRSCRLNTANDAVLGHDAKCVIDRLTRNHAKLRLDPLTDVIGDRVRRIGHRAEDRESLRGDLQACRL